MTRLLSRTDVYRVLNMRESIEVVESTFDDLARGIFDLTPSARLDAPNYNGMALFMPSYLKGTNTMGTKTVTVYKDNPFKYEIDKVSSNISLFDPKNGKFLAFMDGRHISTFRNAASAALATRHLSRKDSRVHAVIGTGDLARAGAWAIDCVREISKVIICSDEPLPLQQKHENQLKEIIGCEIVMVESVKQAVSEADIVTLTTNSVKPVINAEWIKPGTHINSIGAHTPNMRELDSKSLNSFKVVCDQVESCLKKTGDLIIPIKAGEYNPEKIHGSLVDLITGKASARENSEEITLFKNSGLVALDISIAGKVYLKALEQSIGVEYNFSA